MPCGTTPRTPPDTSVSIGHCCTSRAFIHDAWVLDVNYEPHAAVLSLRLRCGDLQRRYSRPVHEVFGGGE